MASPRVSGLTGGAQREVSVRAKLVKKHEVPGKESGLNGTGTQRGAGGHRTGRELTVKPGLRRITRVRSPFSGQADAMKLSGTTLDLDSTDYTVTLDPAYTMLEFDSLRMLPVESGKHSFKEVSYC